MDGAGRQGVVGERILAEQIGFEARFFQQAAEVQADPLFFLFDHGLLHVVEARQQGVGPGLAHEKEGQGVFVLQGVVQAQAVEIGRARAVERPAVKDQKTFAQHQLLPADGQGQRQAAGIFPLDVQQVDEHFVDAVILFQLGIGFGRHVVAVLVGQAQVELPFVGGPPLGAEAGPEAQVGAGIGSRRRSGSWCCPSSPGGSFPRKRI